MFDHAVLGSHFLGGQCQADCNCGQKSFRNICHNYSDEKNDCVTPIIPEHKSDYEENYSDKYCDSSDDVNEVVDLSRQLRLVNLQS